MIKVLLDECGREPHRSPPTDEKGTTPLHLATAGKLDRMVGILLKSNADVDKQDREGTTALHLATLSGSDHIVDILLKSNADVEMENGEGWTALHTAAMLGHDHIVDILLKSNAGVDSQVSRLNEDEDEEEWEWEDEGWEEQQGGETALHLASWLGHDGVVEIFLEAKADVARGMHLGGQHCIMLHALAIVAW